jgi:hypothetical protein
VAAEDSRQLRKLVLLLKHIIEASGNPLRLSKRASTAQAAMQAGADTIDELLQRLFN